MILWKKSVMYDDMLLKKFGFMLLTLSMITACVNATQTTATTPDKPAPVTLFPVEEAVATYTSEQPGTRVIGTKVWLQPPPNFTAASNFPGFQQPETLSSIMVNEMPGPVLEVTQGMTAENMATRGMNLINLDKVLVNGETALLAEVMQYVQGAQFSKWMLLLGDANQSVMVMGTYPAALKSALGEQIKQAVLTTAWDKNATVSFFDGLSFRVAETAELKLARRVTNMVVLTREGEFGKPGAEKPAFLIGTAISDQMITDVTTFAKQRILMTARARNIDIIGEKKVMVDGVPGYALLANAEHEVEKIPMRLFQVIVPFKSNYLLMQGLVGESLAEQYLPQFYELTDSVTLMQ